MVALGPDRQDRLAAEDVDALLERVDMRIDRAARRELIDAQPRVHRSGTAADHGGRGVVAAVAVEHRVARQSALVKSAEVMHQVR